MGSLTIVNMLAHLTFVAQGKKLPLNWQQPQGEAGNQYPNAFKKSELAAVPTPLCYFWPASLNKYHVDACKERGDSFKSFVEDALSNIKDGVDMWRLQAKFQNLKVLSLCALGTPGCLDAPDLKDCVPLSLWPNTATEKNEKAYRKAVVEGVSECWKEWSSKVMIPGLPFYPAFIVYPGPMAPPTPNIPFPLITCLSPGMAKMTPTMLRDAMIDKLDSGIKDKDEDKHHEAAFLAIGTALSIGFLLWLVSQQVMNVLGKGPIPIFAPPYVPVGPVLAGDNIAIPGHLAV